MSVVEDTVATEGMELEWGPEKIRMAFAAPFCSLGHSHLVEMSHTRLPSIVEDLELCDNADVTRSAEDRKRPIFHNDSMLISDVVIKVHVEHLCFRASNSFYL